MALAGACLVADLVTKWIVFYPESAQPGFHEGMVVGHVTSWWRIILVYNPGITFGLFEGAGAWLLAGLTAAVIAWLTATLWKLPAGRRLQGFALSIVIGGAVGNLYDRTVRTMIEPDKNPGVRDFLDWYVPPDTGFGQWLITTFGPNGNHWYTSNVADVLIVCGVVLLAWCILREPSEEAEGSAPVEAVTS